MVENGCVQVPAEQAFVWPSVRLCVKRFLVLNLSQNLSLIR